jgi:hypothetical protein
MTRSRVSVDRLRSMPNYADATFVPCVSSGAMSSRDFQERYVKTRTPLVVRGGVRHWRAWSDWDQDYLRKVAACQSVYVTKCLLLDFLLMVLTRGLDRKARAVEERSWFGTMSLPDYLEHCTARFDPSRTIYARNLPLPASISRDVGPVSVQTDGDQNDYTYFMGRRSYTDSHEHMGFDTFMCQVRGVKEVILHPPDPLHWRSLYANRWLNNWSPVRFFDVDLQRFPRFARNRPYKAVVGSGDALYIPDPWWHAVVSADDDLEITVTVWFKPPFLTLSSPQTIRRFIARPRATIRAAWELGLRVRGARRPRGSPRTGVPV